MQWCNEHIMWNHHLQWQWQWNDCACTEKSNDHCNDRFGAMKWQWIISLRSLQSFHCKWSLDTALAVVHAIKLSLGAHLGARQKAICYCGKVDIKWGLSSHENWFVILKHQLTGSWTCQVSWHLYSALLWITIQNKNKSLVKLIGDLNLVRFAHLFELCF